MVVVGLDGLVMLGLILMYHVFYHADGTSSHWWPSNRARPVGCMLLFTCATYTVAQTVRSAASSSGKHQTGKKRVSDLGLRGRPAALACRSSEQSAGRRLGVELGVSCWSVWLKKPRFFCSIWHAHCMAVVQWRWWLNDIEHDALSVLVFLSVLIRRQ